LAGSNWASARFEKVHAPTKISAMKPNDETARPIGKRGLKSWVMAMESSNDDTESTKKSQESIDLF
jgi:hypothetical protein